MKFRYMFRKKACLSHLLRYSVTGSARHRWLIVLITKEYNNGYSSTQFFHALYLQVQYRLAWTAVSSLAYCPVHYSQPRVQRLTKLTAKNSCQLAEINHNVDQEPRKTLGLLLHNLRWLLKETSQTSATSSTS